jgi:hypothetical protein
MEDRSLFAHRPIIADPSSAIALTRLATPQPSREAAAMTTSGAPVAKLSGPGDIVSMIPYVLGFMPDDSLVLVALEGPNKRFGPVMRLDLAETTGEAAEQVDYLVALVDAHKLCDVVVVAYSDDARRSDRVVRPVLRRLRRSRASVTEALRADGHRWYSYTCHKRCCPPSGVRYDADSSAPSAEAVFAGLTRAESRDALRAMFAPEPDAVVARIQAELQAIHADRVEGESTSMGEMARMLAMGAHCQPRQLAILMDAAQDDNWIAFFLATMTRQFARESFELWRTVMRVAPDDQMAGPGALAAFAAWLNGNGVLASHAADRVEDVAPGHTLVALVRSLLDQTVPPYIWDDMVVDEEAVTT